MNALRRTLPMARVHDWEIGGGAMKVLVAGAAIVFVIFYIMTSPDQAANITTGAWNTAVNVAHGLGDFVNKLAS
jgi:hypothetical protein